MADFESATSSIPPASAGGGLGRLGDKISLPGSAGRNAGAVARDHPPKLRCNEGSDRQGCPVARSRAYVLVDPAASGLVDGHAEHQRSVITQDTNGVPGVEETLLGQAVLGPRIFLHHQRQCHRRCHTSVSGTAFKTETYRRQPVVV